MAEEIIQPEPNIDVDDSDDDLSESSQERVSSTPRQGGYRQGGGGARRAGGGQRRQQDRRMRRRVCSFCVDKVDYIDYKKTDLLSSYVTHHGKIYSRRRTGTCARHQRRLAIAIKRARFLALLPYTTDHIRLYGSGGDSRPRYSSSRDSD